MSLFFVGYTSLPCYLGSSLGWLFDNINPMSETLFPSGEQLRYDTLHKLPSACGEIVDAYVTACSSYGLSPGIVRLFVVGSMVQEDGRNFRLDSDVDFIFSVEHPEWSMSALPTDTETRSMAEDELLSRHEKLINKFESIWHSHKIYPPLNIPHGETSPHVWGMELKTSEDFSEEKPGMLLAEYDPKK